MQGLEQFHCQFDWRLQEGTTNIWKCGKCPAVCERQSDTKPAKCEIDYLEEQYAREAQEAIAKE
jgi:ribosomal protein L37AE/L43A